MPEDNDTAPVQVETPEVAVPELHDDVPAVDIPAEAVPEVVVEDIAPIGIPEEAERRISGMSSDGGTVLETPFRNQ